MKEKLLKEITKCNQKSVFKIRYRKQKIGYSIYLEIQRKDLRKTINLKGFNVIDRPSKIISDKQIIQKAHEKQLFYNHQYLLKGNKALVNDKLRESNIIDFYNVLLNKKTGNTRKNWSNALRHFRIFSEGFVKFSDITIQYCENYREYLLSKVSENTTCTYFSNFKAMLNVAVMRKLIDNNPASYVKNSVPATEREFLTVGEIKLLSRNYYENGDIQNAFLFSCFTGLRISDIIKLSWNDIKKEYLEIRQHKTDEPLRIKLPESANKILRTQKELYSNSDKVFQLPGEVAINRHLGRWLRKNGINKHITFHCARHTFATMCLTFDIDLYTVSKLLGHTDIKHTQIYAKIIDKKRDEAINKLPVF